ncbi:LETM1 domain-containing protein 1 isoform X2 [Apus apus]|uniref:LETM1 domain-containing protein 1 isoform X2 n=1 Tax=Apus apus TaxID=8895 RepID=UPI0021F9184E|nr:LETM1 domain-containing protein 1 isoform X2 [Apus apus]
MVVGSSCPLRALGGGVPISLSPPGRSHSSASPLTPICPPAFPGAFPPGLTWRGEGGSCRVPVCYRSGRAGPRALLAALASRAKTFPRTYERFLQGSCPRLYLLHTTFSRGIQALLLEVQEIRKIRWKMSQQSLRVQQLPYRDMERLRQVFLPTPAPDPLLLDPCPAGGIPGDLRLHPERFLPGCGAEFSTGSSFPSGAAAGTAPAGALRRGAERFSAVRGRALRPPEFVFGISAGSEQAPGVPRASPEPGPVPHHAPPGVSPAAAPAEPRPGDRAPGPGAAAARAGPALRGGAAGGLLPPWPELHSPGPGRVPSVAAAVAGAVLQAPSLRSLPAGQQPGPAVPQLPPGQGVRGPGPFPAFPRQEISA